MMMKRKKILLRKRTKKMRIKKVRQRLLIHPLRTTPVTKMSQPPAQFVSLIVKGLVVHSGKNLRGA